MPDKAENAKNPDAGTTARGSSKTSHVKGDNRAGGGGSQGGGGKKSGQPASSKSKKS
jgi:hypothetical protein